MVLSFGVKNVTEMCMDLHTIPYPPNDVHEEDLDRASGVRSSGRRKRQHKSTCLKTCRYSNFKRSLGGNLGVHRLSQYNNALATSTEVPISE